ncbi:MAG TPA: ABC transporter ATP-binding protein [Actinocrinis sp.]
MTADAGAADTGGTDAEGADTASPRLEISGLFHEFGTADGGVLRVLDGVDLTVRTGRFAAVIGPSGSGKSTLFDIVAGLTAPTAGSVLIDGAAAAAGRAAYMPQQDLLFPWRTVEANAALGLEVGAVAQRGGAGGRGRLGRREAVAAVRPLLAEFGLGGFERSYPAQLSGGMRQRAALARTVAMDRPLMLLDEPFGALDALTRTRMQLWLAGMCARHGWTILLVTHDVREAVFLADTVFVFTERPARIAARIEVDLPAPRTAAVFGSPGFARLEKLVLDALGGQPEPGGAGPRGGAGPDDGAGPDNGAGPTGSGS